MTMKFYVCNWEYYDTVKSVLMLYGYQFEHTWTTACIFDIKIHYVQGGSKPPNLRRFKYIAIKNQLIISMLRFYNGLLKIMNIL